jgi:peptidoglycan hydrolase-like protein with peptidoglycan-binding domain
MSLQSNLFRGDARLEAAAVSDPAHIMRGAAGEHVAKLQTALIALDRATLVRDSSYGPATAQAVLFYKQKRGIINRSYQTQADNIVGKMTMASLDREMVELEQRVDAEVCHCREFGGGQSSFAFGKASAPAQSFAFAKTVPVSSKQAAPPAPALPGTPSQQAWRVYRWRGPR